MSAVTLCECFARDGLQHEVDFIPTQTKVALVDRFAEIGFKRVEATSYSNPKVVPQFADASELLKALPRREGVFYKASSGTGSSRSGRRLWRQRDQLAGVGQ
jgi:hydroxymethylglutaryl-CoA lyase